MTSPFIEELIVSREAELATITTAAERLRIEGDLAFLHDELARIDGAGLERVIACNPL